MNSNMRCSPLHTMPIILCCIARLCYATRIQPIIIRRYITYVYDSKYFLGKIFNHRNYENLGHNNEQHQKIEAVSNKLDSYVPSTKNCFTNYFCRDIAQNHLVKKNNKPMKYNLVRTINFCSTPQKNQQNLYLLNCFVRTFHKIFLLIKNNKPKKYNVVRTIYFCSTTQKILIFLCILDQIKLCQARHCTCPSRVRLCFISGSVF